MSAALVPRVRVLVLCDDVLESDIEGDVFTLEGVRQHIDGIRFPVRAELSVFVVLFSARKGVYRGNVVIASVKTDRALRYLKFQAEFDADNQVLRMGIDLGSCEFAESGLHVVQVWFSPGSGHDVLKAQLPFDLFEHEV